ncbi:MAG TPA: HPr family phosphocarrier protein [Planctomycetaceae bacterium]|nr:HPr family phosphocarrier protein [Planctomycetaceae bacterium]HRF02192.1 HPr family phosphocarrier protein [Pirellulaceae bacterium]
MSVDSAHASVVVCNPQGLHLRPAYLLAGAAERFQSRVELIKDGERVDAKSILSIVGLNATEGTSLQIDARGPDAEAAVGTLVELFRSGFPEATGDSAPSASAR